MSNTEYCTPGQLIEALLGEKGWTKRTLAIVLGADETGISKILAGKRAVTAEMALALSDLFGVSAERFLALQQSYDLAQARLIARPDPGRAKRAALFGGLPVADMIKRGWLRVDDIRNVAAVEAALADFFGVSSTDEIEILPHAAKRTEVSVNATPAQLAWLYRVKRIAGEMMTARFSPESARDAIRQLSPLLSAAEESRHVPKILMEAGIRFVICESLPGAKIDGVCLWLSDSKPVIALSMRHDRIDNFWFVLRHEMEHVIQGHGKSALMLDAELEGERAGTGDGVTEEERVANKAASEFCVPQRSMDQFIARKEPRFSEADIIGFARSLRIHPGLVAGQLQYRTSRYDRFRAHQVKIRSLVSPGSIVDGWGDVAPIDA